MSNTNRATKYTARLNSGHIVTMISPVPLTPKEAGEKFRNKFGQGGRLMLDDKDGRGNN